MKKIEAIIKPFRVDAVQSALAAEGIHGMTLSEVRGFGRQKGQPELYEGSEYTASYLPKVKIELVVPAELADKVAVLISGAARTGKVGDGKVFIVPVDEAMRIRTGECGENAV